MKEAEYEKWDSAYKALEQVLKSSDDSELWERSPIGSRNNLGDVKHSAI